MLLLSFSLLLVAALPGGVLVIGKVPRGWWLGALHGLLGITGLVTLLFALRGPSRGVALGVGSFGSIAAVLLAGAALIGLAMLVVRWRYRRVPTVAIGVHASLAVSGIVILAAYTWVG